MASVFVACTETTQKVKNLQKIQELNDALAVTNEELYASNEELGSINEELAAANEQLAETQETLSTLVKQLSSSEEKILQAIDTGKMGTWSIDPYTLKVTMSDFVKNLLGLPVDREPEMEMIMKAVDPDYHSMLMNALDSAITNGSSTDTEYPVTNLITGQRKWVKATGRVFNDRHGNKVEYSGLFMDITERKMDELRKNDFIGMVSHELKTPLTTLTALIQVLHKKLQHHDDAFIAGGLDKANTQVKKMSAMINGFLTISRLESGKITINKEPFDLFEVVRDVADERILAGTSHQFLLSSDGDCHVLADKDKIASVVSNLLSNAVKYSPKRTAISLHVSLTARGVCVAVADQGVGIRKADAEKLFERYYRVEDHSTKHIAGFGIGLYLSAEIVERHEGRIWVESEFGEGATFYFTLPSLKFPH